MRPGFFAWVDGAPAAGLPGRGGSGGRADPGDGRRADGDRWR